MSDQLTDYTMVDALTVARDFVAKVCGCKKDDLIFGKIIGTEEDDDIDVAENCFLYDYNKYLVSLGHKKIRRTTFVNRFLGYKRNLYYDEAKLYVRFLYSYLKENCPVDTEENLSLLKGHLKKILDMHRTESYDNITFDDVDSFLNRLYGITDSPTNENPREEEQTNNNYIVVKDRTVTEDDMLKATKIDEKCYRGYIKEGEFFSPEKCSDWNKKSGCRLYTMIKDLNNHVLGYINAVAVTDQCYKDIREGKYPDAQIDLSYIVKYTIPGEYNMYFSSIAIDEELQGDRNLFIPLFNEFLDKLIKLVKEEDIVISRIVADAVTDEGKEICKGLGMEKIIETGHDKSVIYELILYPPQAHFKIISSKCKELYKLYKKRFEQLNDEED